MTRPDVILFDLDGTLVDTAPDFFGVVNSLRLEAGKAPLADNIIREQVSNGGVALSKLTWDIGDDHPQLMDYRQILLDRYEQTVGTLSGFFDGFTQVLTRLSERRIRWGIVTNKPRLYTELLLQRLGISTDVLVCPEDVVNRKPAPDALLKAARDLGVASHQCWYVGDHIRDIESARAAGMFSIAALYGYIENGDDPANWQADTSIEHPLDLLALIND
ncbi:HAD-IA family hydrolase [Thalassolituus sp. LLYu03]|uniref:HAD-IA family hydrolase n=1 Tax=Thalassolituus sp. LLYu03 TaxID=3421656 RepID=UPI003D2E9890